MKTIKSLIIDDEPLAHKIIERFAKDVPFLEIVGQCYFATDAYEQLEGQDIDLIFLDIEMPKIKGLDFLKTLVDRPKVILTTAYEEYAIEGFELQVSDYLLKPFSFDRFLKAVNKVRREKSNSRLSGSDKIESSDRLFVKVDKRQIQIDTADIQCLESYGNYVKIWLEEKMLLTSRTLSSFEKELNSDVFYRVHKSFMINKVYVNFVEGNVIHLNNTMEIPVGKSHRFQVKEWFG